MALFDFIAQLCSFPSSNIRLKLTFFPLHLPLRCTHNHYRHNNSTSQLITWTTLNRNFPHLNPSLAHNFSYIFSPPIHMRISTTYTPLLPIVPIQLHFAEIFSIMTKLLHLALNSPPILSTPPLTAAFDSKMAIDPPPLPPQRHMELWWSKYRYTTGQVTESIAADRQNIMKMTLSVFTPHKLWRGATTMAAPVAAASTIYTLIQISKDLNEMERRRHWD